MLLTCGDQEHAWHLRPSFASFNYSTVDLDWLHIPYLPVDSPMAISWCHPLSEPSVPTPSSTPYMWAMGINSSLAMEYELFPPNPAYSNWNVPLIPPPCPSRRWVSPPLTPQVTPALHLPFTPAPTIFATLHHLKASQLHLCPD